uniref:NADH-ubiquinone oxidoreductase chain 4 n=1 Tax=Potamotrygonocestus sp. MZUSP 7996 TaxID=2899500 RepID=A0A8K1SY69_9CEST|nr:NADH dehydrogenase subunit 4 [Potamotrygonocestus sp. MZUSP 7996]
MYQFFSFSFFLVLSVLLGLVTMFSGGVSFSGLSNIVCSNIFLFDSLSYYLLILVFFLGLYSVFIFNNSLSTSSKMFLGFSLIFSAICFCINNAVLFWCFYELSMLPLLFLIFKDSPYSERFIAGWYFAVYLLITSLPLILILLYLSYVNNSLCFNGWSANNGSLVIYITLVFIFFTKVPLMPFHTWLPIVHAEATSIVSIFLSGYIMKLGLLGVYRCASFLFNDSFFYYLFFCCVFSIFFLVTASKELDGKRWLAFLSLSHIVVAFLAFYACGWESISLAFLFCLGHGLSAGLVFGLLWFFYDVTNTRNWLLLKSGVSGKISLFMLVISLLSLCSFPPTLQFFCEVNILCESINSYILIIFWSFYLFFGGLVPLVLCGHVLIRSECIENLSFNSFNFSYYFYFMSVWCYLGIFLL